jgi:hypothetical protein
VAGQWSDDAFLDRLRQIGDSAADQAVATLIAAGQTKDVSAIFRTMRANDDPLPPDAPQAYRDFMAASAGVPPNLDFERLDRGGAAFYRNALPAVVAMLASSLPRGYAAACLSEVLTISRDLERHPFNRLMGVVQLLINISDTGAFAPQGRAVITALKLRLLHAGVRTIVPRHRKHYHEKYGVPVNLEDMLATIMGFSWLIVDGTKRLGVPFTEQEAEDNYYLWRVFALLMGIHPAGRPHDWSYIPDTLSDAGEFYASYARRNDVRSAADNAHGIVLAQDNLRMMAHFIPRPLRWLGFRFAPKIWMAEMMTAEEMALVGVKPLAGHTVIKHLLGGMLRLGRSAGHHWIFATLARDILQGMVDIDRGGEAEFSIPFTRLDLRSKEFA